MSIEGTKAYCAEIRRLQAVYRDRIAVHLGIEHDIFSDVDRERFDYSIGAVHYVEKNGIKYSVDESRELFLSLVQSIYAGDYYSLAEDYFALEGEVYNRTGCNIIAHFDLITKYNEGNCFFDTGHPRYRKAAEDTLEKLIASPCLLEVNTGAMAKGYRTQPYPEKWVIDRWLSAGKELIFSSDCHKKENLLYGFSRFRDIPHRERL
jgi:histidinol-phosphatase (PHP family)